MSTETLAVWARQGSLTHLVTVDESRRAELGTGRMLLHARWLCDYRRDGSPRHRSGMHANLIVGGIHNPAPWRDELARLRSIGMGHICSTCEKRAEAQA